MPLHALSGDPCEALGDPNRRAIVELLRAGDRSVSELAEELPISRPAVSRHLRLLKQAGLVADRAEGTRRLYRLDDEGIAAVREYLEHGWGEAAGRFLPGAENTGGGRGRGAPGPSRSRSSSRSPARPSTPSTPGRTGPRCGGRPATPCRRPPGLVVTFEPRPGGRIYERTPTGPSTTGARSWPGSHPT